MPGLMHGVLVAGLAVALSGCLDTVGPAGDDIARVAAKGVVNTVVQSRFPGVNAAPYTDCIIDNASSSEILQIATAAATGADQATSNMVVDIAARPDTVRCFAGSQFGGLGLGL